MTADESQIRDVLRQHETRHHEVELQVRGIDHQLTTTAERIREEFQMEVREAVASGRSAVAIWLQKQTSEGGDSEGDGESESSAKSASIAIIFACSFAL